MAVFQTESGACTGRGFADVDANGYLAKFKTWIVKAPAAGGPGWTILLDKSANPIPVTITSVDTGTEIFTKVNHGFYTGEQVLYETDGSAIGGLTNGSYYFLRKINADTYYLCSTFGNSTHIGPVQNITSAGSGTHTITLSGPFIVIAPTVPATNNTVSKIIKLSYLTNIPGFVYFEQFLSWDDTDKILRGMWAGWKVGTVDAGDFAYDFRGGDECMAILSRVTVTWYYAIVDEWEGLSNFVEDESVIGTLQAPVTTSSSVVVQLDVGEASLFTVNHWYYFYDFGISWHVKYCEVIARDTVLDTLTLNVPGTVYEMTTGSVIGAYPHRFYAVGNSFSTSVRVHNIPYCSDNTNVYSFYGQSGSLWQSCQLSVIENLNRLQPDDLGLYGCMKPIVTEYFRHAQYSATNYQNRQYGKTKNFFQTYGSMAQMLDYREINGTNYIKINPDTTYNYLFLHSTSLV